MGSGGCIDSYFDLILGFLFYFSITRILPPKLLSFSFDFLQAKEIAEIQHSETAMNKMPRQRGRWSQPTSNIEMTVKSMLDLRQLESFSVSRSPSRDSLSQTSNGDDREEHADLSLHVNKVTVAVDSMYRQWETQDFPQEPS